MRDETDRPRPDRRELPTLWAMGEHFGRLGEADGGPARRRRRTRRWRGWAAAAVATAVGAGGVAVATELIAIGTPQADRTGKGERYRPVARGTIDVTATDTPLRWGVEVYANRDGRRCVLVGQLRGSSLGVLRDGSFRPYETATAALCRSGPNAFKYSLRRFPARTVIYGIARPPVATMEMVGAGRAGRAAVGPRGAFLFVLTRDLRVSEFRLVARRADGRVVR